MRNKILVLVLALICLFAVAAVAEVEVYDIKPGATGDVSPTEFNVIMGLGHNYEEAKSTPEQDYLDAYAYNGGKWMNVYGYTPATCTADGTITLKCTGVGCTATTPCTAAKNVTIKLTTAHGKLGHEESRLVKSTDFTCTTDGSRTYFCNRCEKEWSYTKEQLKAENLLAHHLPWNVNMDGSYSGTNPANKNPNYNITKAPTCTVYGYTYDLCSVCGEEVNKRDFGTELIDHNYTKEETTVVSIATCLQDGVVEKGFFCTMCGAANPSKPSEKTVTPKINHTKGADEYNLTKIFNTPGALDYYDVVTPVETNAEGLVYVKPATCDVLDDDGHKIGEEIRIPAEKVIDAELHLDAKGNYIVVAGAYTFEYVAADCLNEGSITITCENCDFSVKYAIEAEGHISEDKIIVDFKDADCTETYKVAFTCKFCKKSFEEVVGGHSDHVFPKNANETNHYRQYQNNGLLKVDFYEEYDENGNLVKTDVVVNGTGVNNPENYVLSACAPYYKVLHCGHQIWNHVWCGEEKLVEVKPNNVVNPHSAPAKEDCYKFEDSTCVKPGIKQYTCLDCGNFITEDITKLKDHDVEKWSIDVKAECGKPGSASAVCGVCKQPVTKDIPALIHELKETTTVQPVGCVDGYILKTCANCDAKETIIIPAEHTTNITRPEEFISYEISKCNKVGHKTFKCTTCQNIVTVPLDEVPHKLVVVDADNDGKADINKATCCTGAYYVKKCDECGYMEPVFTSEALGHPALTKAELEQILEDALADNLNGDQYVVKGSVDCVNGATGTKLCLNEYPKWTEKDGKWSLASKPGVCDYEYSFELPALGHDWSNLMEDPKTGDFVIKCRTCGETKTTEKIKPEYDININGTKGSVKLVSDLATPLTEAWVRISYGFELSDGSYLAITTCMPITFEYNEKGEQVGGTFSFFALNTSLESTGVNYMVVDQYDAMTKPIGSLVGSNYGMYIE